MGTIGAAAGELVFESVLHVEPEALWRRGGDLSGLSASSRAMKGFISQSEEASRTCARGRTWLRRCIQHFEPWASATGISKGQRWSEAIRNQLAESGFGAAQSATLPCPAFGRCESISYAVVAEPVEEQERDQGEAFTGESR
jgi:hypothetical protein